MSRQKKKPACDRRTEVLNESARGLLAEQFRHAIFTTTMPFQQEIFLEISAILLTATAFATLAKLLRQPMIPAYILAGILLGPSVLHILKSEELLHALSTFGIAFLLFLVGMELDIRSFLKTSRIAFLVGILQMLIATGVGYVIIRAFHFSPVSSLFLAIALGFSSTIVVLKLLGEKKELDTLYGQIVIGILLMQDFIAVLLLIFFHVFVNGGTTEQIISNTALTVLKGTLFFGLAFLCSRTVLRRVFAYFAHSSELLFLGAICWCLFLGILSYQLGFSIEVGALLAGVSLSLLPYSVEISFRVRSLRDFFLPIFFAILGSQLIFTDLRSVLLPTIVLSALVLIVTPVVVIGLLILLRYRSRTSFQVGNALGQISEFSFIVVSLGYGAGLIEREIVSLTALIGLVTMTLSVYMMHYDAALYRWVRPLLKRLELRGRLAHQLELIPAGIEHHVVLFGHHTMGYKARRMIEKLGKPILVVDHNPDVIAKLSAGNVPHLYGSIGDEEVLEKARLQVAESILSTVPHKAGTLALLQYLKKHRIKTPVIVTAFRLDDALEFYERGASYVIFPQSVSAEYMKDLFSRQLNRRRTQHVKELTHMQEHIFAH